MPWRMPRAAAIRTTEFIVVPFCPQGTISLLHELAAAPWTTSADWRSSYCIGPSERIEAPLVELAGEW